MKTRKTTARAKARRKCTSRSPKAALSGPKPKIWGPYVPSRRPCHRSHGRGRGFLLKSPHRGERSGEGRTLTARKPHVLHKKCGSPQGLLPSPGREILAEGGTP